MAHLVLALLLLAMSTYVESVIDNSESDNQKATKILPRRVRDLEEQYGSVKELITALEGRFETECSKIEKIYQQIAQCPPGYIDSEDYETCFKLFYNIQLMFDDAKQICAHIHVQGRLVVLNTPEKFSFFQKKATDQQLALHYWIGLERDAASLFSVWIDDTPQDDTNWGLNQPNNWNGNQDCGYLDKDTSYKIGDKQCKDKLSFICEVPMEF